MIPERDFSRVQLKINTAVRPISAALDNSISLASEGLGRQTLKLPPTHFFKGISVRIARNFAVKFLLASPPEKGNARTDDQSKRHEVL